ncbi:hypothetical protein JO972_09750 [Verrucomicrobiaceae bacterium 5K15]|uniref:Uncharacterized protein n=1 Tax=Oceaniferula flava TaxID=2800421 RepID=A0AAE2VC57_9BACT|nr:hypothetical protein [Oceaniferula flavus]MBK1855240.1 hypothetical protein [Oceaniferula flavus]MBM1136546.1 hypothetical protein [Oceaniferula flavus]
MGFFSSLFGCNKPSNNTGGDSSPSPKTLEEKLEALASCGIKLRPEFSVDDLLSSWGRAEYEEPGFSMTLVGVGMTQEEPPWTPRSKNLWHFDTECIEDHGSYVDIAKRMVEMADGSLPLTDIEDYVDIEEKKAWLSFKLDGKPIRFDCEVDNDWVDSKVFGHFVNLLAQTDSAKIFFYFDLGGQDCIVGCVSREDYDLLRKLIPEVVPLT